MQSLRRQPQADDPVLSLREAERGGRDLNNIAAALFVEQVGAAKLVCKGLAVVAIAGDAINGLR